MKLERFIAQVLSSLHGTSDHEIDVTFDLAVYTTSSGIFIVSDPAFSASRISFTVVKKDNYKEIKEMNIKLNKCFNN